MNQVTTGAYWAQSILKATHSDVEFNLCKEALDRLDRASAARKTGDRESCHEELKGTVSILIELADCLEYNEHGSLALRLDSLYNSMIRALQSSGGEIDDEALEVCRSVLGHWVEGWRQVRLEERRTSNVQRRTPVYVAG